MGNLSQFVPLLQAFSLMSDRVSNFPILAKSGIGPKVAPPGGIIGDNLAFTKIEIISDFYGE